MAGVVEAALGLVGGGYLQNAAGTSVSQKERRLTLHPFTLKFCDPAIESDYCAVLYYNAFYTHLIFYSFALFTIGVSLLDERFRSASLPCIPVILLMLALRLYTHNCMSPMHRAARWGRDGFAVLAGLGWLIFWIGCRNADTVAQPWVHGVFNCFLVLWVVFVKTFNVSVIGRLALIG